MIGIGMYQPCPEHRRETPKVNGRERLQPGKIPEVLAARKGAFRDAVIEWRYDEQMSTAHLISAAFSQRRKICT
jgi:hypothetical protein